MKAVFKLTLLSLFIFGCTEIKVEDQALPSLNGLTPQNIESELPIFNLNADSAEFRNMFRNPGEAILIAGDLTYWDESRVQVFSNIAVHVEIKGKSSAYKKMKSLGIIFDSLFDNDTYQILDPNQNLDHHSLSKLEAVRFRNSGNDFGLTMLKDISYTQLARQANVDFELMYHRQCQFFVNGEYYGLLNLRTENNQNGMAGLNGVPPEQISVIKVDIDNENLEWDEGPRELADQFEKALKDEDAETIWALIDESSFIDYLIFQDYIGNHDWPHNNTRMYSVNGQPFRFVLYDTDFAGFNNKNAILPEMEYENDDMSKLYREMRKKTGFDYRLKARKEVLYERWSFDIFKQDVGRNAGIIENELPYFMAKYGEPMSTLHWRMQLDLLRREFRMRDINIRDKYDL